MRADRIYTLGGPRGDARSVEAILVRDGIVCAAGGVDTLGRAAPDAAVIDLRGTTITPGFTDAHIHVIDWAIARRTVDLAGAESPVAAAAMVAAHLASSGDASSSSAGWVRGGGWNASRWGAFPERGVLDSVVSDRPILLRSHDMHAAWVNTRALEVAGVGRDTPDPEGGRIVRDAAGEPTGVLLENAVPLVERAVPAAAEADLDAAVLDAQAELHRMGITGIHSFPSLHPGRLDPLRIFERMRASGRLRLRVLQHLPVEFLDDAVRLGLRSGFGGDRLRIGAVKMFLDGALGSRTAWLLEPYVGGEDRGVRTMEPGDFRDVVRRAAEAGLASTVHAIGDAAVCLALDVLGDPALRVAELPHRIEHVQLCPPARLAELGRAGIVASVQPSHLMTDWRAAERDWGSERCRGAYAFESLRRGGATLAFGSDAPVEPVDPRLALYAATTRRDPAGEPAGGWFPEERIDIVEAVRGYTTGPAVAAGDPRAQGSLAPGAVADFVAWSADPIALARGGGARPGIPQDAGGAADRIEPAAARERLLTLRCVATAVAGELVHREDTVAADGREPETAT